MLKKAELFFREKKWKNIKKSDWAALALTGVLLLLIAMPVSPEKPELNTETAEKTDVQAAQDAENAGLGGQEYASYTERRLETILGEMEGVGKVKVMITLADFGENIVEKDKKEQSKNVSESDAEGGVRKTDEYTAEGTTVYVENGNESYPYVEKEVLPTVEGVLVVAEGGGNPAVVSNISDTVKALFKVEAHKIKVVKMSSKEE